MKTRRTFNFRLEKGLNSPLVGRRRSGASSTVHIRFPRVLRTFSHTGTTVAVRPYAFVYIGRLPCFPVFVYVPRHCFLRSTAFGYKPCAPLSVVVVFDSIAHEFLKSTAAIILEPNVYAHTAREFRTKFFPFHRRRALPRREFPIHRIPFLLPLGGTRRRVFHRPNETDPNISGSGAGKVMRRGWEVFKRRRPIRDPEYSKRWPFGR